MRSFSKRLQAGIEFPETFPQGALPKGRGDPPALSRSKIRLLLSLLPRPSVWRSTAGGYLQPRSFAVLCGTAEAVPFQNRNDPPCGGHHSSRVPSPPQNRRRIFRGGQEAGVKARLRARSRTSSPRGQGRGAERAGLGGARFGNRPRVCYIFQVAARRTRLLKPCAKPRSTVRFERLDA